MLAIVVGMGRSGGQERNRVGRLALQWVDRVGRSGVEARTVPEASPHEDEAGHTTAPATGASAGHRPAPPPLPIGPRPGYVVHRFFD